MTKTIEQIFEETSVKFRQQMIDAVEEAIEGVYADYLPHVESDNAFNVAQKARSLLVRFMDDSLDEHDKTMLKLELQPYTGKQLRAKMFEDNREELTKLIGEDIIQRVKDLEERVAQNWEVRYG